jgi:hypothetical protein
MRRFEAGASLVISMLILSWVSAAGASETRVTPAKAVELAEQFIERHGYTDKSPTLPISYESLERGGSDEKILELRRATLKLPAYGYSCGDSGCVVIFRYAKPDAERAVGRAVTMDPRGQKLKVEHQDIFLSAAEVVIKVP